MILGRCDVQQAHATLREALDAGVTLIDTADTYAPTPDALGYCERLVATVLAGFGGHTEALVATKFGHVRTPKGGWLLDGRPEHVRNACDHSLRALRIEAIGLYQYHRPDPRVPYAETIGALKELRDAGKVRLVGVSNANLDEIRIAEQVLGEGGLASVQNEFSPRFLHSEKELRYCADRNIAFLPWSPLGGIETAQELPSRYAMLARIGASHGVSPQRVCLAWMLHVAPNMIPIPGATRPETIRDSAAAAELQLTHEELVMIEASMSGAGPQFRTQATNKGTPNCGSR